MFIHTNTEGANEIYLNKGDMPDHVAKRIFDQMMKTDEGRQALDEQGITSFEELSEDIVIESGYLGRFDEAINQLSAIEDGVADPLILPDYVPDIIVDEFCPNPRDAAALQQILGPEEQSRSTATMDQAARFGRQSSHYTSQLGTKHTSHETPVERLNALDLNEAESMPIQSIQFAAQENCTPTQFLSGFVKAFNKASPNSRNGRIAALIRDGTITADTLMRANPGLMVNGKILQGEMIDIPATDFLLGIITQENLETGNAEDTGDTGTFRDFGLDTAELEDSDKYVYRGDTSERLEFTRNVSKDEAAEILAQQYIGIYQNVAFSDGFASGIKTLLGDQDGDNFLDFKVSDLATQVSDELNSQFGDYLALISAKSLGAVDDYIDQADQDIPRMAQEVPQELQRLYDQADPYSMVSVTDYFANQYGMIDTPEKAEAFASEYKSYKQYFFAQPKDNHIVRKEHALHINSNFEEFAKDEHGRPYINCKSFGEMDALIAGSVGCETQFIAGTTTAGIMHVMTASYFPGANYFVMGNNQNAYVVNEHPTQAFNTAQDKLQQEQGLRFVRLGQGSSVEEALQETANEAEYMGHLRNGLSSMQSSYALHVSLLEDIVNDNIEETIETKGIEIEGSVNWKKFIGRCVDYQRSAEQFNEASSAIDRAGGAEITVSNNTYDASTYTNLHLHLHECIACIWNGDLESASIQLESAQLMLAELTTSNTDGDSVTYQRILVQRLEVVLEKAISGTQFTPYRDRIIPRNTLAN